MDAEDFPQLPSLVRSYMLPVMRTYMSHGNSLDKTLWLVTVSDEEILVLGPLVFDRKFFVGAGYSDEAITRLEMLVGKARCAGGVVVTAVQRKTARDFRTQMAIMKAPF